MDLSEVPIHQRLDALLERLDDDNWDETEYLQFVDRRAQKPIDNEDQNNDNIEDNIEDNEDNNDENVDENVDDNDVEDAAPIEEDLFVEPNVVEKIYKDAGLAPRVGMTDKQRRHTAKQAQRQFENAARLEQEMERSVAHDVGVHTVKKRTVDSFLADLNSDDSEPEPKSPASGGNAAAAAEPRFSELVSSPPRMQGLQSFVNDKLEDSDSDLEVIPETKTNRMPKAVKTLLKFSGSAGTQGRHLAQEAEKLMESQRKQILQRRMARLAQLKEHGVDIELLAQKLSEQRAQNTMSSGARLEQERERANTLRAAECSDEESESETEAHDVQRTKMLVSDESEDESAEQQTAEQATEQAADESGSASGSALTKTLKAEEETDEEDNASPHKIGRTGTQYVPPLPQTALNEMLGASDDDADAEAEAEAEAEAAESSDEELEILTGENQAEFSETPNLSDLQDRGLTVSQHLTEVRQRFLKAEANKRRKNIMNKRTERQLRSVLFEDQAEESDDEENGGRLNKDDNDNDNDDDDDDDDDDDAEVEGLVDHGAVAVKEAELRRQFLEEEKKRDERLLNRVVDGVHSGFRRRREGRDQFLSDDDMGSDDEAERQMQEYLRAVESRRKSHLVSHNADVGKLASNTRAAAFFASISEDLVSRPTVHRKSSVQESIDFLRSVAAKEGGPLNRQEQDAPPSVAAERTTNHPLLPTVDASLRRRSTVRIPERATKRGTTYASRISAVDLGQSKTVEILQSLGGPSEVKKAKRRFVDPQKPTSKRSRPQLATGSVRTDTALFKRSWA